MEKSINSRENTPKKSKKAGKREIIEFYTRILRMELEEEKIADAMKAAEFFVKYYGMLEKEKQENKEKVIIVDDIAKVREELNE